MGRQSSRLYYNGKDHKDIYYNGKYHNAMYFKEQGGLIWQKLLDVGTLGGCLINTKISGLNETVTKNMGINFLNPTSIKLDANVTKSTTEKIFLNIISGKNRAFGIRNIGTETTYTATIWVTKNGYHWKTIELKNSYKRVYPCYDGFLYVDTNNNVYKVVLNDENKLVSENLIYENFNLYYDNTGNNELYQLLPRQSINGIWARNGTKLQFLTHTGMLLEYEFSEDSSYFLINFTFNSLTKSYVYIQGEVFDKNYPGTSAGADGYGGTMILSCDGTEIKLEAIRPFDTSKPGGFIGGSEYTVSYVMCIDDVFYFFEGGAENLKIVSTSDFLTKTDISEWTYYDYIELELIGGATSADSKNVNSAGIDTIRLYPTVEAQQYLRENYSKNENVAEVRKYDFRPRNYAAFANETLVDYGTFSQVGGNLSYMSMLAIYLDSPIITKETKGFAYFTDNIGIGVSYP